MIEKKEPACKELRELYCSKHAFTHLKLSFAWIGFCLIYWLSLFNSAELEAGDPLSIGILFGLSESFGVLVGERFLAYVNDYKGILFFMPLTLVLSSIIKLVPGLDTDHVYVLFCL